MPYLNDRGYGRGSYAGSRQYRPVGSISRDGRMQKVAPGQWIWRDSGRPVRSNRFPRRY